MQFLVTAGPTREYIDPIRYISNKSSGKMGIAIANVLYQRGHKVFLILGPTHLKPMTGVEVYEIETAEEMLMNCLNLMDQVDVCIMSAAVCDFKPKNMAKHKIKKQDLGPEMSLEITTDILTQMVKRRIEVKPIIIGFAAEDQEVIQNAKKKLLEKNLDAILVNDIGNAEIGMDKDYNEITVLWRNNQEDFIRKGKKEQVAEQIVNILEKRLGIH